ncbi:MAG: hypothetical protein JW910_18160 [Anaerolineae bacterium]|nr:hypothetical protein [Anaerolineae bacterium]
MKFAIRVSTIGVLGLLLFILGSSTTSAQATIHLSFQDDCSSADDLQWNLPDGQTAGELPLYLCNASDETISGLTLVARLLDDENQVLEGPRLTLQPDADFVLEPDTPLAITLVLEDMRYEGTFTALLQLRDTDDAVTDFELTLTRTGIPTVKIVQTQSGDAADQPVIARTVTREQFELLLTFTLEAENPAATLDDVTITLGQLTRSDALVDGLIPTLALADEDQHLTVQANVFTELVLTGALPAQTSYTGWLAVNYAGKTDLYTLNLTRAAPPPITVIPAGENAITKKFNAPMLNLLVTLVLAADQPPVDDLHITIENEQADNQTVTGVISCQECQEEGQPLPLQLQPGEPRTIHLVADELDAVPYTAQIVLRYSGASPQIVTLTLTPAELLENLAQEEDKEIVSSLSWSTLVSDPHVDISITVKETHGIGTVLNAPQLVSLHRKDNDTTSSFAHVDYDIYTETAGTLTAMDSDGTIPVAPFKQVIFVLRLKDLPTGTYTGSVIVHSPTSQSVSREVEINVKHYWVYPAVFIVLGTGLAWVVAAWVNKGRKRAHRLLRMGPVRQSILQHQASLPDDQATVWRGLSVWLNDIYQLPLDQGTEFDTQLGLLRDRAAQYPLAMAINKDIQDLLADHFSEQGAAESGCDRETLSARREALWRSYNTMVFDRAKNITQLGDEYNNLKSLRQEILLCALQNYRSALQSSLNTLQTQLDGPTNVELDEPFALLEAIELPTVGGITQEVFEAHQGKLRECEQAYLKGYVDYLKEAVQHLRNWRKEYNDLNSLISWPADKALAELENQIEAARPTSFATAELARSRRALTASRKALLLTRIEHLNAFVAYWFEHPQYPNDEAKQQTTELKKVFDEARQEVERHLTAGEIAKAEAAYNGKLLDAARALMKALGKPIEDGDLMADAEATQVVEALQSLAKFISVVVGAVGIVTTLATDDYTQLPDEKNLLKAVRMADSGVLFISLVVATISGLLLRWDVSADFGSFADYATAFLWGFTIQAGADYLTGLKNNSDVMNLL